MRNRLKHLINFFKKAFKFALGSIASVFCVLTIFCSGYVFFGLIIRKPLYLVGLILSLFLLYSSFYLLKEVFEYLYEVLFKDTEAEDTTSRIYKD